VESSAVGSLALLNRMLNLSQRQVRSFAAASQSSSELIPPAQVHRLNLKHPTYQSPDYPAPPSLVLLHEEVEDGRDSRRSIERRACA
jgi:hypothetical protein